MLPWGGPDRRVSWHGRQSIERPRSPGQGCELLTLQAKRPKSLTLESCLTFNQLIEILNQRWYFFENELPVPRSEKPVPLSVSIRQD